MDTPDSDLLRRLFIDCCLEDCAQLTRAVDRQDRPAAIHHSHRLHGSALMMSASVLTDSAGRLEQDLREGLPWRLVPERLRQLQVVIEGL